MPDRCYYNASRGRPAEFRFACPLSASSKSLFAKGRRVDKISQLGPRASRGIILYEWLVLGGVVDSHGQINEVPELERFWRTLVADRGPDGRNAPSWYYLAFVYCLKHLTSDRDIDTSQLITDCDAGSSLVVKFLQHVQSVIWNRRFLVSGGSRRFTGLSPMAAQVGDEICILYGCSVPVVLRLEGDHWLLVGECYVDGIMDGEAVDGEFASGVDVEFEIR
jgi:hypothetical protein